MPADHQKGHLRDLTSAISQALDSEETDWIAASDVWLDLQVDCIGTPLEDAVRHLGDLIAGRDREASPRILERIEESVAS